MSDSTTSTSPDEVDRDSTAAAPTSTPRHDVVIERHVVQAPVATSETPQPAGGRRHFLVPFVAGFVTAVVAGAISIGVFLAVSDSDDDGEIQLEVPAVDLDVGD